MNFDSMTDREFFRWLAPRFASIFVAAIALGFFVFPVSGYFLAAVPVLALCVAYFAVTFWYHFTEDAEHHGFSKDEATSKRVLR